MAHNCGLVRNIKGVVVVICGLDVCFLTTTASNPPAFFKEVFREGPPDAFARSRY